MKIQERSYSSKIFRPKPHLHLDSDGQLLVVATSWGQQEHAAMVSDEIVKYVTAAREDVEVTSPFEFLTSLSPLANNLRIATLIANDVLYRGENRTEYVSGIEILTIARVGRQVAWAQVGSPHILFKRSERPLVPLAPSYDHSFEISLRGGVAAPLPSRLLGVDPTCNVVCGDLNTSAEDLFVLLSSSNLPTSLWQTQGPFDLQGITQRMVAENSDEPFWLGILNFS